MKKKEFTLSLDAAKATRAQMPWIKSLFSDIEVRFEDSSTSARTKIEWLSIIGESESTCEKAKNYITSLTSPSAKAIVKIPPTFKKELLKEDSELLKSFERESAAVIVVDSDTDEITIQGVDELLIVLAKSLIDETLQKHKEEQTKNVHSPKLTEICDSVKNFAIKLGYNDDDIMIAVHKCNTEGKIVNANTLLQELVKSCPQKLKDSILKSDLGKDDEKLFVEIARSIAEVTTAQTTTASSSQTFCETLRDVVIDGSNVAMCHGHAEVFSCTGIDIVVDWFKQRGHENIVVFVPQFRQEAPKGDTPISDQHILEKLHKEKVLVFTPSRKINGRRVVCYDDRFIVKHAVETDGIIVSNDNFRDLQKENPEWKSFLEQRLLMYSFVKDRFMPPDDPLGRCGPTLNEFLKKGPLYNRPCPYKNKCTYGSKCRYYHAEKDPSVSSNTTVSQSLTNAPLPSLGTANLISKKDPNPPRSSYIPETCGSYDRRQLETNYLPTHEVIARGCASVPTDYASSSRGSVPDREWQRNHSLPVYQQTAYYPTSTHLPTQRHSQYYLQAPSWDNYAMHRNTTYSTPMYSPSRTPPQPQVNSYMMPAHQPHVQYPQTPPPPNPAFSIMPGYVDPRTLNQYYRAPCQINSPYVQPMAMPLETSVVSPTTRSNHDQYMVRHNPYSHVHEEHVRLQRLLEMFPASRQSIYKVLSEHPNETNLDKLASYVLAM